MRQCSPEIITRVKLGILQIIVRLWLTFKLNLEVSRVTFDERMLLKAFWLSKLVTVVSSAIKNLKFDEYFTM